MGELQGGPNEKSTFLKCWFNFVKTTISDVFKSQRLKKVMFYVDHPVNFVKNYENYLENGKIHLKKRYFLDTHNCRKGKPCRQSSRWGAS